MSPLFLANWKEINRAFCALCWMAALALAVVILGVATGTSATGTSTADSVARSVQPGTALDTGALHVRRHP